MVTVFTNSDCVPCRSAKQYLSKRGVEYTEADVFEGDNMARLMKLTGRMITPTILVEGEETSVVVGFNMMSLAKALTKA